MKLLKIILFFFAIYFIRRLFQMYKFMQEQQKRMQEEQLKAEGAPKKEPHSIETEYKVLKD